MVHSHYVAYPAIIDDRENTPGTYTVTFPDVPGAISQGVGIPEALENGAEALALMLYDEKILPTVSDLSMVNADNPETIVSYIMVDLIDAAKKVKLGEPTFIINPDKSETVTLNKATYDELVRRNMELEEQLFDSQLQSRIKEGPGNLVPSEEEIEANKERNPFSSLSDKDLFD
ncbi:type II toxin-antitoxin system HicB family antitoxin [uncultured Trichococcus sp.]|uniref:type II toxin-antitoxin system HicB family antitoxin n=1 Tax=uncultured Trichococcus sp. TaxID=189665 RepID=UPI0029C71906|nr:type II toxin-antitoxin system HicB family antitoxin [uncultured Trichococcus sp.]